MSVKNWIFYYSLQKKGTYWSFWCQGWLNHQDEDFFWENRAVEAVEASEVAEADEVNEAAEVSKGSKITNEDFKVIQVLEFSLFWCFEKESFLVESWNIMLNFSNLSVGGCWRQPMLLFWKMTDQTQNSKPPEAPRHHKSSKFLIPLPLRAI